MRCTHSAPAVLLVLIGCLTSALGQEVPRSIEGRHFALLIGVNHYVDAEHLAALRYSADDARLMHRVLTTRCHVPPEQIVLMCDDPRDSRRLPFQRQVETELERLAKAVEPGDTLTVFFSGHGIVDVHGEVTLATRDCIRARAAETGLSGSRLKQTLERSRASRKLLILDCCHAGAAKASGEGVRLAPCFEQARGLVTLASCSADQLSQEWPEARQGLFTCFLARGLQGDADRDADGIVDIEELYKFVYNHVATTARTSLNAAQHPQLFRGADVTGVFPVVLLGGSSAPYPVRGQPGQTWRRRVTYRESYTVRDGTGLWPLVYVETQDQRLEVRQTDVGGRPTVVTTRFADHVQESSGRLPSGTRNRRTRGPWQGLSVVQEWRPIGPSVVLAPADAGKDWKSRSLPHPLAVDEALLPDVPLKVGESTADSGRVEALFRQLLPEANVEFSTPPTITLARVADGGRVLVFEGKGDLVGCLATPQRTAFHGAWTAEYLPREGVVRRMTATAESRRVSRGRQEFFLVLEYGFTCEPE